MQIVQKLTKWKMMTTLTLKPVISGNTKSLELQKHIQISYNIQFDSFLFFDRIVFRFFFLSLFDYMQSSSVATAATTTSSYLCDIIIMFSIVIMRIVIIIQHDGRSSFGT